MQRLHLVHQNMPAVYLATKVSVSCEFVSRILKWILWICPNFTSHTQPKMIHLLSCSSPLHVYLSGTLQQWDNHNDDDNNGLCLHNWQTNNLTTTISHGCHRALQPEHGFKLLSALSPCTILENKCKVFKDDSKKSIFFIQWPRCFAVVLAAMYNAICMWI